MQMRHWTFKAWQSRAMLKLLALKCRCSAQLSVGMWWPSSKLERPMCTVTITITIWGLGLMSRMFFACIMRILPRLQIGPCKGYPSWVYINFDWLCWVTLCWTTSQIATRFRQNDTELVCSTWCRFDALDKKIRPSELHSMCANHGLAFYTCTSFVWRLVTLLILHVTWAEIHLQ